MQCSDIGNFIFFEYAPSSLYSKTLESMLKIDPSNRLTPLKFITVTSALFKIPTQVLGIVNVKNKPFQSTQRPPEQTPE